MMDGADGAPISCCSLIGRLSGRGRQRIGYAAGALCSATCVSILLSPQYERLRSPGPANAGHERLACAACHRPAPGTIRQQLQANARHLIGLRDDPVDFGLVDVRSEDCVDCHERPDDRHPIYRFLEPRFAAARAAIAPHECISCHREHSGRRITIENRFCESCHAELEVPDDPVRPTHEGIAQVGAWSTCLRCHDFHGSHDHEPPRRLEEGLQPAELDRYFLGGPSPWPGAKRTSARQERSR